MYKYLISLLLVAGVFISIGLAKDSPQTEKLIIKSKGQPTLGVVIVGLTDEELKQNNIHGGAKVKSVMKDSEAEKIGLKEGDIIVRFDGSDIADPRDLRSMVNGIDEEKKVEIVVIRDGKEKKFDANLKPGEKRSHWSWNDDGNFKFNFDNFPHHFMSIDGKGGFLGVETTELSDQLKKYFEVDHGVLIESVIEDSPAQKAGLKAGDVITEISGRKIEDYGDLIRTVNYYDPGETVEVKYSRKGKLNSTKVELGERKKMKWEGIHPDKAIEGYHLEDQIERNLDRSMKQLDDNLRGLEKNLKKLEKKVEVI